MTADQQAAAALASDPLYLIPLSLTPEKAHTFKCGDGSVNLYSSSVWAYNSTSRSYSTSGIIAIDVKLPVFFAGGAVTAAAAAAGQDVINLKLPVSFAGGTVDSNNTFNESNFMTGVGNVADVADSFTAERFHSKSGTLFKTLLKVVGKELPSMFQLPTLPWRSGSSLPRLLSGSQVMQNSQCKDLPLHPTNMYLNLALSQSVEVTLFGHTYEIPIGTFDPYKPLEKPNSLCIALDVCDTLGKNMFFETPEGLPPKGTKPRKDMDDEGKVLLLKGLGFSTTRSIPVKVDLPVWDGVSVFKYPVLDRANVWSRISFEWELETPIVKTLSMEGDVTIALQNPSVSNMDSIFSQGTMEVVYNGEWSLTLNFAGLDKDDSETLTFITEEKDPFEYKITGTAVGILSLDIGGTPLPRGSECGDDRRPQGFFVTVNGTLPKLEPLLMSDTPTRFYLYAIFSVASKTVDSSKVVAETAVVNMAILLLHNASTNGDKAALASMIELFLLPNSDSLNSLMADCRVDLNYFNTLQSSFSIDTKARIAVCKTLLDDRKGSIVKSKFDPQFEGVGINAPDLKICFFNVICFQANASIKYGTQNFLGRCSSSDPFLQTHGPEFPAGMPLFRIHANAFVVPDKIGPIDFGGNAVVDAIVIRTPYIMQFVFSAEIKLAICGINAEGTLFGSK